MQFERNYVLLGLFHKAIALSGSAFNNWGRGCRRMQEIAPLLKLDTDDKTILLQHLRKLPVEEILRIQDAIPDVKTIP